MEKKRSEVYNMKILLADDEEELTHALGAILKFNDYDVDIVNKGEDAYNKALIENYDLLILDVMMPKMEGTEVTIKLRENNVETPILMLTAKAETEDKVEGLDMGANDYLTKPFNKDELLARIRAITRNNQTKIKSIKIGNVTLNREDSEIYTNKATFKLNNKECKLMETLINNRENTLNTDDIRNKVWDENTSEQVVSLYISYLQKKFEALGANIEIDESQGYKLREIS